MLTEKLNVSSITEALGIYGWSELDTVILAALTTELPVLLVGAHGTAKSYLVERLAQALGLEFRHYNASLINYDDLVGIPLPEEEGQSLRFVATPGAIWPAQFVFFDEISRCRPDLQNKLFPIIHERRVVGVSLSQLRYCWSAMNPPSGDELNSITAQDYYLGSESLDPALLDRFPFVISVPSWRQMNKLERRRVVHSRLNGAGADGVLLTELIEKCRAQIPIVESQYEEAAVDYILCAMDLLERAKLPQSPRRARMFEQMLIAIHAARCVLEGEDADFEQSAQIMLRYGLPQNATEVPPSLPTIYAIHKQAWELSSLMEDDIWRIILEEEDLVKRVLLGVEHGVSDDELSRLVTQALNADEQEHRKIGLATAMFLAFRFERELTPAALEFLSKLCNDVLCPRSHSVTAHLNSPDRNLWNEIYAWANQHPTHQQGMLEIKFVLAGFPNLWRQASWKDGLNDFRMYLDLFGVKGCEND